MKLSQFDFFLPDDLIAKRPMKERGDAKLMVVNRKTQKIQHKKFADVLNYFTEDDLLVFNNTKVFPAILKGKKEKTEANIEVFLLRELKDEDMLWDVLVTPARKIRIGNKLYFTDELIAEVIDNTTSRGRTIKFIYDGDYKSFKRLLKKLGTLPLPPFLERPAEKIDKERYQNIFAKNEGAVAVPTAGMHFGKTMLKRFELLGAKFAEITLHAGIGNFRGIEVEDLSKHKMDSEQIITDQETADIINEAKQNKKSICAVGTTVVKTLEVMKTSSNNVAPFDGWSNKFIFPPYDIKIADKLITNFHLPFTPMLMTVSAFGGYRFMKKVYETAVDKKYKFGTYGDAMLII